MDLIKPEMTPKERAKAYAAGDRVDRIPVTFSIGETIPPMYGYDICDYYFSVDAMVDVETRVAEDFQADNMGIGLGLRTMVEAMGTKMAYPKKSVSYIDKPLIDSLDQVDGLDVVDPLKDGRIPLIIQAFDRLQDRFGDVRNLSSGLAGPFTAAAGLFGTERLLRATRKDPEGVHKLMCVTTECVVTCAHDLRERLGIGFMLAEPMASRDVISKRQFDEFFLPYLHECVERMNAFQGATSLHICGHTSDRWADCVDAGICAFWMDNKESLASFKRLHGDRVAISGNVPPVEVLANGTPHDIEQAIIACLREGADNPRGYTLCPGCTVPTSTPKENIIAFMNAAASFGAGARKGALPEGLNR